MNTKKYMQTDSRWSQLGYPKSPCTIGNSGCGEVSICNAIIEMKQYENYTPATIQPYCKQFAASNCDGTYWSGIPKMMKHYGSTEVKEHQTMDTLWKELAKGDRVAIYLMGSRPGGSKKVHWTSGGHFICSVDYRYKDNDHQVYVKDSYSNATNRNGWCGYKTHLKGDVSAVWSGKLNGAKPSPQPTPSPTPTPTPTPTGKLTVDGIGGTATVKRMQQFFGTTQDGYIGGQLTKFKSLYPSLTAVKFGKGGSQCIIKLQKWLGLSDPDGIIGKNTTNAWQKKLRTLGYLAKNETIDGIVGVKTMKAWQECLNNDGKPKGNPSPSPTPKPTKYKVIDISYWQSHNKPKIDFNKVKADGVVGVIIRQADGEDKDSYFDVHMKGAKAAGLHIGAYVYSRAKTKAQAEAEATRLFNACKPYGCDMPLYIDLEAKGLEKYANTVANAFLDKMKSLGAFAGVYANLNWWNNHLTKVTPPARWVAQYYKKCEYKGGYGMWQYSSSGSVNGIKGNVDMDWCYVDYWNKINPKPSPTPTPTPTKSQQDKMCEWAKKIANSGEYKYKRWKSGDKKTQECPICKNLTGKYKGWNCIGFAWASWHHSGLNTTCNCGVISNDTAEKMLKAKTDADAKKIAQKYIGTSDIKVIRNKSGIAASSLKKGDVVLYFKGNTYFHTVLYVGNSKVAESNTTTPNITYGKVSYHKTYGKVAIRYTK